jgi:hypothetical protein
VKRAFRPGPLLALVLILALTAPTSRAENLGPGGSTRIIVGDQVVGPYRLYITASPEPAQTGIVTFVVRVSDPKSDANVRDAQVMIQLVHGEDGSTLTGEATHRDSGNPVDYAAHMRIDRPGVYDGVMHITAQAGAADVTFTQRILPPRQFGTALALGLPFVLILGALGIAWYRRSTGARPDGAETK